MEMWDAILQNLSGVIQKYVRRHNMCDDFYQVINVKYKTHLSDAPDVKLKALLGLRGDIWLKKL